MEAIPGGNAGMINQFAASSEELINRQEIKFNCLAIQMVYSTTRLLNNVDTFLYLFHISSHLPDYPDLKTVDKQSGDQDYLVKGAAN